jgi:hypothetical protein
MALAVPRPDHVKQHAVGSVNTAIPKPTNAHSVHHYGSHVQVIAALSRPPCAMALMSKGRPFAAKKMRSIVKDNADP